MWQERDDMTTVIINGELYVPESNVKANKHQFKSLGDALTYGRKNCNMSISRAADRAGISKSHLWALEKNESEPSLVIAAILARLYGLDLNIIANLPRL